MLSIKYQIKKNYREIFILLGLIVLYFALRLPNLTLQPIFVDEAIYIRWAQIMKAEPTLRFVSLSDGKTPLFMWAMTPLFKIFSDPLFAGRILSVLSGFITFSGVLFLGWRFFGKRVGIWAAFLYVITPYFIFFDRMALVDSMLAAFSIWVLNLSLLLIQFPRFDLAMVLGYVLGGGLLTKTPGFFNVLAFPFSILTFNFSAKNRQSRIVRIFLIWLSALIISLAIYNILRLGPGFTNLSSRNQDYVRSPAALLVRPWDPFVPHFWNLSDWSLRLIGIPVLILLAFGIFAGIKDRLSRRTVLAIFFFSLMPLFIQMNLLQTFTARYILFSLPPLLVLAALGVQKLTVNKFSKAWVIIFLVVIIWPAYFNFQLLTNPQNAPLPKGEREGYFEMWTAGYGFKEIAEYLDLQSLNGDLVVGTEGSFGTLPEGLQIYLDKNRRIAFIPGGATVSAGLRVASLDHPAFFVANKSRYFKFQDNIKLIKEFPKAKALDGTQDSILLFEVRPLDDTAGSVNRK